MADTTSRDAVIIGGGHNGLVCAFYLAKSGMRVTVCEARGVVGQPELGVALSARGGGVQRMVGTQVEHI